MKSSVLEVKKRKEVRTVKIMLSQALQRLIK